MCRDVMANRYIVTELLISCSSIALCVFFQIEYRLSRADEEMYGATFDVNPLRGSLGIKRALDHESAQSYTLTIEARDNGPNSIPGQCRVEIRVLDENDNAPQITVNTLPGSTADKNTAKIRGMSLFAALA